MNLHSKMTMNITSTMTSPAKTSKWLRLESYLMESFLHWNFPIAKGSSGDLSTFPRAAQVQSTALITVTDLANSCATPLFRPPQVPRGCLEKGNHPLSSNLVVWCAKIGPKTKKLWKTVEKPFFTFFWGQFWGFSNFLGFGSNFSAPNHQIRTQ